MVGFLANFDYNKRAGIGLLKVIENSAILNANTTNRRMERIFSINWGVGLPHFPLLFEKIQWNE
jgi:hypothetical protein